MSEFVDNPGSTGSVAPVESPAPVGAPAGVPEATPPEAPEFDPVNSSPAERHQYLTNLLSRADAPEVVGQLETMVPITPEPQDQGLQPDPAPVVTEPGAEVPDKFRHPDGSVNVDALVKSYLNAEKKISEQGGQISETAQLRQLVEQMQAQLQGSLNQGQTQPQVTEPEPAGALTPEQVEEMKQNFFDQFYDDPQGALSNLINNVVENSVSPLIQPLLARQQFEQETAVWQQEVASLTSKYADFGEHRDAIKQVLMERGEAFLDTPGALESAYWIAKGMNAKPQPTLDEILKDPAALERIKSSPDIQRAILSEFTQQTKAEPKPVVVGSVPGGTPPKPTPVDIKSTKDAAKAAFGYFSRNLGG